MSTVKSGDAVRVHYEGRFENGELFDSSRDRGEPIAFEAGSDQLIPGFSQGVIGMAVGDTRTLQNLYQRVGTLVRALPAGSRVALLTPPARVRDLGIPVDRAFESNHGGQHVVASLVTR